MAAADTESTVVVGVAGDIIVDDSSTHDIAAKAGGWPSFSGSPHPCKTTELLCRICKQLMMLALQVRLPHRGQGSVNTLYIFCCTQEACAARTDSWRAYRHAVPPPDSPPQKHQAAGQPAQPQHQSRASPGRTVHSQHEPGHEGFRPAQTDDWGLASGDWGTGTGQSQDADVSEINAALEQLSMQPTNSVQGKLRHAIARGGKGGEQEGGATLSCSMNGLPRLPGFELWLQDEPGKRGPARGGGAQSQQAVPTSDKASADSSGSAEGTWANEQYEEEAAFSKYTRRLQRCPGQCLRLSAAGSILWPRKDVPTPPRCSRCQGETRCVAQLMAPLIAMFYEAAEWVREAGMGSSDSQLAEVPASWEWLTITVFACMTQCAGQRISDFVEETVVVLNETRAEGGWVY